MTLVAGLNGSPAALETLTRELKRFCATGGTLRGDIIEIQGDTGFNDNSPVFEVPRDHYFMMGDNRDNSTDSRVAPEQGGVGYVPYENLIGRAEITFFSVENGQPAWAFWKWPWTVRWHRMFQPVR